MDSVVELISVILIFLFVLFITWFTTHYIANFQKMKFSNHNMQVIESVQIGTNKFLSLVELGDVYLVLAIGKDEVNLIAKLTKEELPDLKIAEQGVTQQESFQELLKKMKDKFPKK